MKGSIGMARARDDLPARARAERRKRGMTQKEVAEAAGMKEGAYGNFERRITTPQPENLRAIVQVLELDESEPAVVVDLHRGANEDGTLPACPECKRPRWADNIELFQDFIGMYLATMTDDAATEVMHETARWLNGRRLVTRSD